MEGSTPPDNPDPQDVTMTNAEDGTGNIFDELLAEMDGEWGSQDPFTLQNEVPQGQYIDPARFAASLGMPDIYSALPDSASPTRQEDQAYPSAVTSSPVRQAEQVPVSTPIFQQANTPASVSEYSPSSTGLHTPTRRDRGHYGSARRRTGALSNFQPIASSPQRESTHTEAGYSFEPIPEHQQGILSPSNYINEDLPEFRPRRVVASPSRNYQSRFDFPEELNSPCLLADPDAFEGGVGDAPPGHAPVDNSANGNGSAPQQFNINTSVAPRVATGTAPIAQQIANYIPPAPPVAIGGTAPHFPNYVPGGPPSTMAAGPTVPAVSNGTVASNTPVPWTSGISFEAEPDPERRAKMQEIASVSHMLLTSKKLLFAAKKAKVLQAGKAADEKMRKEEMKKNKQPAKRARKNATAPRNTNASNSGNVAPPASSIQPGSTNNSAISQPAFSRPALSLPGPSQPTLMNPPVSSAKARGRKVSNTPILTKEERIAQFWNGRLDKFGNELEASFLCHGSMENYSPVSTIENTAAGKSEFSQYTMELAECYPKMEEDTPDPEVPHSKLMLYSEIMNEGNFERAVYSGQVIVVSYDIHSEWWHKLNIFAWNRFAMAYSLDEIAIMITPFHIMFARIPNTGDTAMLESDWRSIFGLVERTFRTPVVGAKEKTWAYMYRFIPCTVKEDQDFARSRDLVRPSLELFVRLGTDTVYGSRFRQFAYYVPPVGEPATDKEFSIRVGRFGMKGEYDRPRVEIRDLGGQRIIRDHF